MSNKKKRRKTSASIAPPAAQPVSAPPPPPAAPPYASASSARPRWLLPLAVLALVLIAGAGLLWYINNQRAPAAASATPALPLDPNQATGGVTSCRIIPKFAKDVGFIGNVNFTTSGRRGEGLIMFDPTAPPDPDTGSTRFYQHPSWLTAGYLGPLALDEFGNIYVAPVPRINVLDNPAAGQNKIYKVDTTNGVMSELMELPATAPPSAENPFGILGLTYDCDTHSLYASTVSGSNRRAEVGRLFHINPSARNIVAQYDNVDALGVGVFNGSTGKRLYFGATRAPEIRSIGIGRTGEFVGPPRLDIDLGAVARDANAKARRINFSPNLSMQVTGVQFDYNLIAPSLHVTTQYNFLYDPMTDKWIFSDLTAN